MLKEAEDEWEYLAACIDDEAGDLGLPILMHEEVTIVQKDLPKFMELFKIHGFLQRLEETEIAHERINEARKRLKEIDDELYEIYDEDLCEITNDNQWGGKLIITTERLLNHCVALGDDALLLSESIFHEKLFNLFLSFVSSSVNHDQVGFLVYHFFRIKRVKNKLHSSEEARKFLFLLLAYLLLKLRTSLEKLHKFPLATSQKDGAIPDDDKQSSVSQTRWERSDDSKSFEVIDSEGRKIYPFLRGSNDIWLYTPLSLIFL
jgi:hypothetical protein